MKKRLPLELEEKVKKAFQMNCLKNDENMHTVLRKFIEAYNRDSKATEKFINKYVNKKRIPIEEIPDYSFENKQ